MTDDPDDDGDLSEGATPTEPSHADLVDETLPAAHPRKRVVTDDASQGVDADDLVDVGQRGARRGPLVAVAVAVVLVLIGVALLSRRAGDAVATSGASPTSGLLGSLSLPFGGTGAPGELPELLPGEVVSIPAFPQPGVTRQPDPLPGPPFYTLEPKAGSLTVYSSPNQPKTVLPNPRQVGDDPNATVPLTLLVKRTVNSEYFEVYLPLRPNGSTGLVKAADVTVLNHDFHIEVRLSQFTIKVLNRDRIVLEAPIGVATDNTPTPGGTYYTTELMRAPNPNGAYGPYAYGLSGYSEVLQTFNGGPGQLGIHGTNQPWAIGSKVSHGCIRLRNEDISKLAPILPLGVPVQIYP